MTSFHTIAVPHKDILEGRLTLDVFAADLWEVNQGRGPDEYRDAETFFHKTYLTQGLQNLLDVVKRRLQGKGGDPVIQIQTPFGGGKTHALIAIYHKAQGWNAKRVVVSGTALSAEDTLWGLMEKQLTGKIERFSGRIAPGKEAIRGLLADHQPVILLMDEVLEYVTKAAGVKVEESTLAGQTMAFVQELTEAAGSLSKTCLVVTLPSSIVEHYDERAEKLFQQLQKVAGRVEKIYTPVQEDEITQIIRRRLFSDLDEAGAKEVVRGFMAYAEKEGIIPEGVEPSQYRDRFLASYPFMPEVVNILYHRWGSFPTFQRTRGVLRLLSLVIHSLKAGSRPWISLADFDLGNQEIRQELLKHIGAEYNGIIASDITDPGSGAKKVDGSLGGAYQGLNLGTRAGATIFLYSFSGAQEQGVTPSEVKRCATTLENPASAIAEAVDQLRDLLFFMQREGNRYFFSNQPNLNRVRLVKMENIQAPELREEEKTLLRAVIKGGKLKTFLWEENPTTIPDASDLKLVILEREDRDLMREMVDKKGQGPRVNKNTLFFLCPLESERSNFAKALKSKMADERIQGDKNLALTEDQKKQIKKDLKRAESTISESLRRCYRMVFIPTRDGFKEEDLGIPTYGEEKSLVQEVYEKLRSDGEILEKIAPLVLKEKYLMDRDYVLTEQLYQAALRTPGESRPVDTSVFENGIGDGVRMGLFGLGELQDDTPVCRAFKEHTVVALAGKEILISEAVCREQRKKEDHPQEPITINVVNPPETTPEKKPAVGDKGGGVVYEENALDKIELKFSVPKGKVSNIMGVMNLLQSKFSTLEISLTARDGKMSQQDYEEKIEETFTQLGIKLD